MSHLTDLLLGTLFYGSVLVKALLLPGYAVLNGNLFYDLSAGNTNPSVYVNSGAVVSYPSQITVPGGGYRFALSGANVLAVKIPVPSTYSSGAVLTSVSIQCGNVPGGPLSGTAAIITGQNASFLLSSTVLRKNITALFNTGSVTTILPYAELANSAAVTIGSGATIKIPQNNYLGIITASGAATKLLNADCVAKPVLSEKYGR